MLTEETAPAPTPRQAFATDLDECATALGAHRGVAARAGLQLLHDEFHVACLRLGAGRIIQSDHDNGSLMGCAVHEQVVA